MVITMGMDVFDRKFSMKKVDCSQDVIKLSDADFNITDALPNIMDGLTMSLMLRLASPLGVFKLLSGINLIFKSDVQKALDDNCKKLRDFCLKIVKERREGGAKS